MDKWDIRFYSLALEIASWSKDPTSKVGCVAVAPGNRHFVTGYNGFPPSIPDDEDKLYNKKLKNEFMVHAEANCIINTTQLLNGWTMYITKAPCLNCAKLVVNSGVVRLLCPQPEGTWKDDQVKALGLLTTVGIKVEFYG